MDAAHRSIDLGAALEQRRHAAFHRTAVERSIACCRFHPVRIDDPGACRIDNGDIGLHARFQHPGIDAEQPRRVGGEQGKDAFHADRAIAHQRAHLLDTVLTRYTRNSLLLMAGVSVGVLALGIFPAWLVTVYRFPGSKVLEWALLLPLAIPAYIIAYTYTGMLDVAGPLQSSLREAFGWRYGDYWFPEIRSLGGAVAMLSLVFYP